MMEKKTTMSKQTKCLVYAAVCLALCMVLPFLTGQIRSIGNTLCPMHIPVLLAGFLCGPWWALAVGATAPLLRFALFGMPAIFPMGIAMCFELATYGLVCGLLYRTLPKRVSNIYVSLISAMACGRIIWGVVRALLSGVAQSPFTWATFWAGAFSTAVPGIIVHIVLIPLIVLTMKRAKLME